MVSQLQFNGVGVQIELLFQVWLIVLANVEFQQSERHDERKVSGTHRLE